MGFDKKAPNLPGLRPCELKLVVRGGAANGRPEASKQAVDWRTALICKRVSNSRVLTPPMMIMPSKPLSLLKCPRIYLYAGAHKQIGVP
jgi:hypothetical protein